MSTQQTVKMSAEEKKAAMQKGREEAQRRSKELKESHLREVKGRVQRELGADAKPEDIDAKVQSILAIEKADSEVREAQQGLADAIIARHKLNATKGSEQAKIAKLEAQLKSVKESLK